MKSANFSNSCRFISPHGLSLLLFFAWFAAREGRFRRQSVEFFSDERRDAERRFASPRAATFLYKKSGAPRRRHISRSVGFLYTALRRRRLSQPNPTSAEPRRVSEAGSGMLAGVKVVSPDDTVLLSEFIVLANVVKGVARKSEVKSMLETVPTGPKAAKPAAFEPAAMITSVP